MRIRTLAPTLLLALASIVPVAPARAQTTSGFPDISQRQYKTGSATVKMTGSETFYVEIALNHQASYSDGEVTWLQFGVSGGPDPEVLITYGQLKDIGISFGKDKLVVTGGIMPGEKSDCAGTVTVTKTTVEGEYVCTGVVSYHPTRGMGKVNYTVRFATKS